MGGIAGGGLRRGYIRRVTVIDPKQLRIRGPAAVVAVAVTGVLLVGALWAASVDLSAGQQRNAVPMEVLAIVYKLLSAIGLVVVGRRLQSKSMHLLAVLLAALVLGGYLIHASWFSSALNTVSSRLADFVPLSSGFIELGSLFLALAVLAAWLVLAAFRAAAAAERSAVTALIWLLFAVGVFVGPVNAISALGINREWLFAEDFGQVVTLSALAGYCAGLVAATQERRLRGD